MGRFIKKKKLHHISPCYYFGIMFSKLFLISGRGLGNPTQMIDEDSGSEMDTDD